MAQPLDDALARVRDAVLDDERLIRAVGSGRRRGAQPAWRRVQLRYVDLKTGPHLQLTSYDERQAHTRNVRAGAPAAEALEALLREPFGNWHVETVDETIQLRVTKKGDALVHAKARQARPEQPSRQHDRHKQRLLEPGDPVLHLIGITDHTGTVKPSRQAKYRQVEEFLRALDAALEAGWAAGALVHPDDDRPLRVIDLGCGNAYLTFAAFAYLQGVRELPVRMVGVDVKAQSRQHNTDLAEQLGWGEQLVFAEGGIAATEVRERPDVVLALHACDTATDEALARALGWAAPVVLAAPCCHHDLHVQLQAGQPPPPYGLLMQHGILRERMADMLTDTLRAAILRQHGYRVEVVQFVDSRHTPRNVLLRAVRTGAEPSPEVRREYDDLVAGWGVEPALARMLSS
ncbi:MAG TPA: SAM-dependent methyltransferase [Nocardioidaceae bacterium]|nr:SAM-dependent methyltransferase [Nocardioidaceae bacterium]